MKIATTNYADIGIVQGSKSKTESRIGFALVIPCCLYLLSAVAAFHFVPRWLPLSGNHPLLNKICEYLFEVIEISGCIRSHVFQGMFSTDVFYGFHL